MRRSFTVDWLHQNFVTWAAVHCIVVLSQLGSDLGQKELLFKKSFCSWNGWVICSETAGTLDLVSLVTGGKQAFYSLLKGRKQKKYKSKREYITKENSLGQCSLLQTSKKDIFLLLPVPMANPIYLLRDQSKGHCIFHTLIQRGHLPGEPRQRLF